MKFKSGIFAFYLFFSLWGENTHFSSFFVAVVMNSSLFPEVLTYAPEFTQRQTGIGILAVVSCSMYKQEGRPEGNEYQKNLGSTHVSADHHTSVWLLARCACLQELSVERHLVTMKKVPINEKETSIHNRNSYMVIRKRSL